MNIKCNKSERCKHAETCERADLFSGEYLCFEKKYDSFVDTAERNAEARKRGRKKKKSLYWRDLK